MTVLVTYELVKRWQYLREHPEARRNPLPTDDEGQLVVTINRHDPAGCLDNILKLTATSTLGCITVSLTISILLTCVGLVIIMAILAITGFTIAEFFSIIGEAL